MFWNNGFRFIETANGNVDYISMRIYYTSYWGAAVRAEITASMARGLEQFRFSCGVSEVVVGHYYPGHEGCGRGSPAHRAMTIGSEVIAMFEGVTNRPAKATSRQLLIHSLLPL